MMCTHVFATINLNPSQAHSLYLPNANVLLHSREGKTCRQTFSFPPLSHTHTYAHTCTHTNALIHTVNVQKGEFFRRYVALYSSQCCDAWLFLFERHNENKTERSNDMLTATISMCFWILTPALSVGSIRAIITHWDKNRCLCVQQMDRLVALTRNCTSAWDHV